MKKLIGSLLLLFIIGGVSSCHNELESEDTGNHRGHEFKEKPLKKTLTLSFGGDYVSESDEPMQRAEDGDKYTAINVYYKEKDKENAQQEKYAYGLFKGNDPISIDVFTGYEYSFEATILKEREDKIKLLSGGYTDPFRLHDGNSANFDNAWSFVDKDKDKFHYTYLLSAEDSKSYFCQLTSGTAYVNSGGDFVDENGTSITGERWIRYPRVKRFYGKLDQYDPSITDQIEIPMKYKSFGLRILIESIPKGTSVKVKDTSVISGPTPKDEPYLIFTKGLELAQGEGKTDSWECIYSLNKLVQDTTSFILRFDWTKGAGETKSVRKIVKVEAKKMKILKLNFEGDVSETKSGNITFTNMDEDMEDWEETFNYNFNGK